MMAYENDFVICILQDRSPVREINGTVSLPFHSDYKVRLKNKHNYLRAKARVWIDGRKVSNIGDIILNPGQTLDLERFLDNDLGSGNKFKFVPLSDRRVNDPTDPENGRVKVEFYREKDWFKPPVVKPLAYRRDFTLPIVDNPHIPTFDDMGTAGSSSRGFSSTYTVSCNSNSIASSNFASEGATVEGGLSGRRFEYGEDFITEPFPITLTLKLKGISKHEVSVPRVSRKRKSNSTQKERFCSNCGKRRARMKDRFCSRCGNAYRIVK